MSIERMLKDNLIKKQEPDFKQIEKQIKRCEKDIETAKMNMKVDSVWAITIAYHSMIRAGRALMYSKGYLPTPKDTHKTIVDFTGMVFGQKYNTLLSKFNRLRKQRHNFIYESENGVPVDEVDWQLLPQRNCSKRLKAL